MALTSCRECGKEISSQAAACPHCGAKPKPKTGCLGWAIMICIGFIVVGAISSMGRSPGSTSGPSPEQLARQMYDQTKARLSIENFSWSKGGFDNVMIASFAIKNAGQAPVKDVEITCTSYGASGTRIDTNRKVIYETFQPNKTKRIREFNMGFQHTQARRASCEITDFSML